MKSLTLVLLSLLFLSSASAQQPDKKLRYLSIAGRHSLTMGKLVFAADGERFGVTSTLAAGAFNIWDLEALAVGTTWLGFGHPGPSTLEICSPNLIWIADVEKPAVRNVPGKKKPQQLKYVARIRQASPTYNPATGSWVHGPDYSFNETSYPLAVTDSGLVVTSDVAIEEWKQGKYTAPVYHFTSLNGLYLFNPATGEKRKLWDGKPAIRTFITQWAITPDNKTFVLYDAPNVTTVDLATGSVKTHKVAKAGDGIRDYKMVAWSGTELCFETYHHPGRYEVVWLNLLTGQGTKPRSLTATQGMQFFGGSAWSYNETEGKWTVYERKAEEIIPIRTFSMDRSGLPIPSSGPYHFQVMADAQVLGIPTGGWNTYGPSVKRAGYLLYCLKGEKVNAFVPGVFVDDYVGGDWTLPKVKMTLAEATASTPIGSTVSSSSTDVGVLRGYDETKDEYVVWFPASNRRTDGGRKRVHRIDGREFRRSYVKSSTVYQICPECKGAGRHSVTNRHSNTQEIATGYFSGIKTTVTRSWETNEMQECVRCLGDGLVK